MVDTVGRYTIVAGAFGVAASKRWSGHWTIFGPDEEGRRDSIADGTVDGPFPSDFEAIHAAKVEGVARATELDAKDRQS